LNSRPVIFISAVSRELRSTRDLVAKTLSALGYTPKWQDIAPTETGDLRKVLRKWIDESDGVLQIVGHRFGFAPKEHDETFGHVSYTQYETLYAKARGKKVWYIVLDDNHPVDCGDDEEENLKHLQSEYRSKLLVQNGLFHASDSSLSTENIVLKLRDDLSKIRRRSRIWAACILVFSLLTLTLITWLAIKHWDMSGKMEVVVSTNDELSKQLWYILMR
jgi:hypothetical protein